MKWKVRRPLAFCMHHLAVILGPEIAANDLAPVFASFMSDVDEVRMGILCHYAEFLQVKCKFTYIFGLFCLSYCSSF